VRLRAALAGHGSMALTTRPDKDLIEQQRPDKDAIAQQMDEIAGEDRPVAGYDGYHS